MKVLRLILTLVLLAAIAYVGYNLYKTIEEPIVFEQQKNEINGATIKKLKKIRRAQVAFKGLHAKYAANFDTLIAVVQQDSFEVVKTIGDPNDSTVVVKREITRKALIDSLFNGDQAAVLDLPFVPLSKPKAKFEIQADIITKNEVEIPAFEVSVPYETLYKDLVRKYYADKIGEVMRVGSMSEGTTTGNWEK